MKTNQIDKEAAVTKKEPPRIYTRNDIFYHYTTLGALYGIIEKKELWLTSMNSTNDPDELDHTYSFASNYIKDYNSNDSQIAGMKAVLREKNPNGFELMKCDSFAMAFTESQDSEFHWSMYGDSFKGVAIGLKLYQIEQYFESLPLRIPSLVNKYISVRNVVYSDCDKIADLDSILSGCDPHDLEGLKSLMFSFIHGSFKREEFSFEKEHRIIFLDNFPHYVLNHYLRQSESGEGAKDSFRILDAKKAGAFQELGLNSENKKFSVLSGNIRPYYPLKIMGLIREIIPEIVLGCKCTQDEKDIKIFLDHNGMQDTKIILSEKKYR